MLGDELTELNNVWTSWSRFNDFFFWKIVDWSWSKILNYHLVIVLELIKSIIKLFNELSLAFGSDRVECLNKLKPFQWFFFLKNYRLKLVKNIK